VRRSYAGPDHWHSAWNAFRNLPALTHQLDSIDRVEISVKHPVMGPTDISQIVGLVVAGFVIKMGNRQACFDSKSAYDTTNKWVMFTHYTPSFAGISRQGLCGNHYFVSYIRSLPAGPVSLPLLTTHNTRRGW
jgi:hypothetical protein